MLVMGSVFLLALFIGRKNSVGKLIHQLTTTDLTYASDFKYLSVLLLILTHLLLAIPSSAISELSFTYPGFLRIHVKYYKIL